jgi:hypothetical protein
MNITFRAGGALLGLGAFTATATVGVFLTPSVLAAVALGAAASLGAGLLAATLRQVLEGKSESVGDLFQALKESPQLRQTAVAFCFFFCSALLSISIARSLSWPKTLGAFLFCASKVLGTAYLAVIALNSLEAWQKTKHATVEEFFDIFAKLMDEGGRDDRAVG